jgi:transcriptional antiterminator RfaH
VERWYVAETQPQSEARALEHLARQGYAAYLPRYGKRRRHARRMETVKAPLFPGYLFVCMDVAKTRWRAIRSTIGIRRLICQGEQPMPVPAGVVEDIQAHEDERGLVPVPETAPFRPGEELRVVEGPLRDQIGWFQRAADRERIVILLSLLGRQVPFAVPLRAVRAAF